MEQFIYSSVLIVLIIIWMIINKRNMNKHIIEVFENASTNETKSNVSLRNFYYYCEKHKIDMELTGETLRVKYNSKNIICTQVGDFRMGRTIITLDKKSSKKGK